MRRGAEKDWVEQKRRAEDKNMSWLIRLWKCDYNASGKTGSN